MKKFAILAVALLFVATGCSWGGKKAAVVPPAEARGIVEQFVNETLMGGQAKVGVGTTTEENGLYKFSLDLPDGQQVDAYLTKDGKKFFPQAMDLAEFKDKAADNGNGADSQDQAQAAAKPAPKSDKPKVELFVMSHCPYGTQIEKGIIPAVEALGSAIDFKLKFVNYAMHGEKELTEQLNQYCIDKEQPDKIFPYLKCFLGAGDSEACLASAKVDAAKAKACAAAADGKYQVMAKFKDASKKDWQGQFPPFDIFKAENEQYGVQGSPTLVINGQQVETGRSPAELLKTICSAFNQAPAACSAKLSDAQPAPGFGEGTAAAGGSAAGCGQ